MKHGRVSLGKTTRPSVSGILARTRLFARLDECRKGPVVWVGGPPGCGKTTLVASYLDHAQASCLWYQLDEGDADVATFFYYLGLAAAEHGGSAHEPLPLLTPEYHAGLGVFTRRYFQDLFSRLERPFVIVFDGYHEVSGFSPFHEVLRDALQELPPGGCVIVISRGDPPATLARLRANGAVGMLGWDELRLTREETQSIISQRRPDLQEQAIEEIHGKTQGWAAGLALVLEQAKIGGSIADPPDLSTRQLVFDYLAGEIFQNLGDRTQEFLLRTVYPAQMSADVAKALTGDDNAAQILAELHRNNFFITLRGVRPEPVYQYHPMFREFLRARVQEVYAKDDRRSLQRTSAALMEAASHPEDALALYRESHEWDEMARVIVRHAEAMLAQGRGETVRRWIEEVPPEVRTRHPWLLYWAASSQVPLAPREARLLYEKAFELFQAQPQPDRAGMVLSCSGAMDAILYELDDFSLMDRWIAVLDEASKSGLSFPSPLVEARVACSMFSSLTARQPHRRDIGQWIQRALASSQATQDVNLRIYVALLAALTMMYTGVFSKAWSLIDAMRRLSPQAGVTPFSLTTLKNVEAMYYMLVADKERCLQSVREGLEITRATGVRTWLFQLQVYGYGAALGSQDLKIAAELARQFEPAVAGAGRFNLCLVHHFQAWEAMLRKDLMQALQHEKAALRMAVEVGCPYIEVLCRLALAEILAECGDDRRCVSHLRQLRAIAREIDNRHLEFACLIGFGLIAIEHGRRRPGIRALRRGLSLGREYDYRHFLWWRPDSVARVCAHALEAGVEVDYVRDLIRRRGLVPSGRAAALEDWPWMFRVQTLGAFHLLKNDEPLAVSGKAQKRPLELLKVLLAFGGEAVGEAQITEAMWPRIEGDSAHRSFTSTLHRLRRLLGEERAVLLQEGRLTLDRRYFWVDAWAFEQVLGEIEVALKRSHAELDAERVAKLAENALELYRGPFLPGDADEAWSVQPRERLRSRFVRVMTEVGRFWQDAGQWQRAVECFERCLEADPLAESFYRHLIVCHQRLERRAEAIEIYHRCRKTLAAFGIEPAAETRALYAKLA